MPFGLPRSYEVRDHVGHKSFFGLTVVLYGMITTESISYLRLLGNHYFTWQQYVVTEARQCLERHRFMCVLVVLATGNNGGHIGSQRNALSTVSGAKVPLQKQKIDTADKILLSWVG